MDTVELARDMRVVADQVSNFAESIFEGKHFAHSSEANDYFHKSVLGSSYCMWCHC